MPFTVAVLDEAGYGALDPELATRLAATAFSCRGFDVERLGEVSVALVGPGVIRDLNLRFRGKDEPTDVLSFEVDGPYGEMVGEVVICPACAEMGVEELIVHGALHLSGMDHREDFEGSEMARAQEAVIRVARGEQG
jgi:probable rRNA maturation factor